MTRSDKEKIWKVFKKFQHVYLATAEGDQPRVRPVTLIDIEERFWVATQTSSAKAAQIRKNPNVEFCLPLVEGSHTGYIRVAGIAEPVLDEVTRARIASQMDFFGEHWSSPDDPEYTLLRISRVAVEFMAPGTSQAETFLA